MVLPCSRLPTAEYLPVTPLAKKRPRVAPGLLWPEVWLPLFGLGGGSRDCCPSCPLQKKANGPAGLFGNRPFACRSLTNFNKIQENIIPAHTAPISDKQPTNNRVWLPGFGPPPPLPRKSQSGRSLILSRYCQPRLRPGAASRHSDEYTAIPSSPFGGIPVALARE